MKKILSILCLIGGISVSQAGPTEDFQIWVPINTNVNFDKHLRGFLEIQPRIGNDASQLTTAIVRPAIGYAIDKHSTIWLGYLMQANQVNDDWDYRIENRLWQGYTFKNQIDATNILEVRNRMEERFLPGNSTVSYRWRTRVRFEHILPQKEWSLIASEEPFVNFNDNHRAGTESGMDQNRAYVGVGYRFSQTAQVESGYLAQYVFGSYKHDDKLNHVWMTNVNLNF